MANRHTKGYTSLLIVRESNDHEIAPHNLGWAIFKKNASNKCWRECGEKGALEHYLWKGKLEQPLWKTLWRFFKKLKIELPYDPATLSLGIRLKRQKQ